MKLLVKACFSLAMCPSRKLVDIKWTPFPPQKKKRCRWCAGVCVCACGDAVPIWLIASRRKAKWKKQMEKKNKSEPHPQLQTCIFEGTPFRGTLKTSSRLALAAEFRMAPYHRTTSRQVQSEGAICRGQLRMLRYCVNGAPIPHRGFHDDQMHFDKSQKTIRPNRRSMVKPPRNGVPHVPCLRPASLKLDAESSRWPHAARLTKRGSFSFRRASALSSLTELSRFKCREQLLPLGEHTSTCMSSSPLVISGLR